MASATSKKTELKLTGVARASLEELMCDYRDYLRQHRLPIWEKNSPSALAVRRAYKSMPLKENDRPDPFDIGKASAEVAANTLLCLINQASYLLRRQLQRLEQDFLSQGGFTERLYRKRQDYRHRN